MVENLLGVHCSIAGGVEKAFEEAEALNINCFQIFTKNQRQWREKEFTPEERLRFRQAWDHRKVKVVFSHASYLINLAEADPERHRRAVRALAGELRRCGELGLAYVVLHPGFARGMDRAAAMQKIVAGVRAALAPDAEGRTMVLLENMAGQGSSLGSTVEEIKAMLDRLEEAGARVGFCFDTCHAFAAGYDIRTQDGIEDLMAHIDHLIGLDRMKVIRLDDSKGALGSHLDRHWHIGEGKIGPLPFRYLMRHFPAVAKVIETPKKDDWDARNLRRLRSYLEG